MSRDIEARDARVVGSLCRIESGLDRTPARKGALELAAGDGDGDDELVFFIVVV